MKQTIVLYPSPGRGHLISMLEFGNHLLAHHSDSFSVAVIIAAAAAPPSPASAASNPSITFHHLPPIPDHPGPPFDRLRLHNPNLRHALLSIPNLAAFVADFFCSVAVEVVAGLKIPTYFYFTSGANFLAASLYLPTLHKTFARSFADLGDQIVPVPGLPPIPAADMPMAFQDRTRRVYDCFLETSYKLADSAGIILNTYHELEERAVRAIETGRCVPDRRTPPIYCIGPLVAAGGDGGSEGRHECLTWLDSQPNRSVLFLSFGSIGSFSKKQIQEIADGLELGGVRFLWVVRSPLPDGQNQLTLAAPEPDLESILPEGFIERTKQKGYVVKSWAPQVAVLSHDSVGGFVTHCGWNSILEAIRAGVPMLAWPLYAEQKLNRVFLVEEAKAALTVAESGGGLVSATELEERVAELMNSDKGRAVRERVKALQERAIAALSEDGSSRVALTELAESLKRV